MFHETYLVWRLRRLFRLGQAYKLPCLKTKIKKISIPHSDCSGKTHCRISKLHKSPHGQSWTRGSPCKLSHCINMEQSPGYAAYPIPLSHLHSVLQFTSIAEEEVYCETLFILKLLLWLLFVWCFCCCYSTFAFQILLCIY